MPRTFLKHERVSSRKICQKLSAPTIIRMKKVQVMQYVQCICKDMREVMQEVMQKAMQGAMQEVMQNILI